MSKLRLRKGYKYNNKKELRESSHVLDFALKQRESGFLWNETEFFLIREPYHRVMKMQI